ncbi:A/G-specific adenine glycosylase [Rubrolithibacter danxiaensis]|uniref:A/G-specific adenine glycosylase n=1 Tax=Rubrolithibacter danxiaensis TaxID=3390805 RepID=UPI003BF77A1C
MRFIEELINWYEQNKRDLPWRNTNDPYIIWLSEIILQQTRVEQGLPYFYRFSEKYPSVSDFASATEEEILKHWQGLGYYSRGRNMLKTARMVMEDHVGYFPKKYDDLIKLKGIGEYTAAAISSFAANEPKAVVDGNVFRLLSRYLGIAEPINTIKGKRKFTEIANELIDKKRPGTSNQAMMEFGSQVCKPQKPDCVICPLQIDCEARRTNHIDKLPVKLKNQKIRNRYFNYIVAVKENKILMNKRGPNDIWENLFDFPLFETPHPVNPGELKGDEKFTSIFGQEVEIISTHGPLKHVLSHQRIFAQFLQIDNFNDNNFRNKNWFYIEQEDLEKIAQPKLIFAFFKNCSILKFKSITT